MERHQQTVGGNSSLPTRRRLLRFGAPPHLILTALLVALLFLSLDQLSKQFIASHYSPNEWIIGCPYASLVYVTNTGGICGYAQGSNTILAAIGILTTALILLVILFLMPDNWLYAAAFGLLLAGAGGNLIDRLRLGYVIDFITLDLLHWPSFNIADGAIVGGIGLIGLHTLWELWQERTAGVAEQRPEPIKPVMLAALVGVAILLAVAYLFCVFRPLG